MSNEALRNFIQANSEENDFTGGIQETEIVEIEQNLGVIFPESYKWFLKTYGMGGLYGVEILGRGKSATPSVITNTERFRTLGLPAEYIVIENCEEFVYCLDTSKFSGYECPIVSWDRVVGDSGVRAENFQVFLLNRLVEARESWEEGF